MPLTTTARKRIMKDMQELATHPLHDCGIYVIHNENDISKASALLFGPEDTPYEHGPYFFQLKFPENYPFDPPKARFMTQDPGGKTRFHPNLYTEGKVCLSILNTWSGPSWTSVQTLSSVLLSIKSLLDEKPLENEPGFENTCAKNNENFNGCIRYENLRVAILYQLQHLHSDFDEFRPIIEEYFLRNFYNIRKRCVEYEQKYQDKEFYCSPYSLSVVCNYTKILVGLNELYANLLLKYPTFQPPETEEKKEQETEPPKQESPEKEVKPTSNFTPKDTSHKTLKKTISKKPKKIIKIVKKKVTT